MLSWPRHNTARGSLALTANGHLPVVQAVELANEGPVDGGGGGKGDSGRQLAACRGGWAGRTSSAHELSLLQWEGLWQVESAVSELLVALTINH